MLNEPRTTSSQQSQGETVVDLPACGMLVRETTYAPGSVCRSKELWARFCLVLSGSARGECNGKKYVLGPEHLSHTPAGQAYLQEVFPKEPLVVCTFHYRPDLLIASVRDQLVGLGFVAVDLSTTFSQQSKVVRGVFQELVFEQTTARLAWETMLQSRLLDIAVRLLRLAERHTRRDMPTFAFGNESLDRVALYVQRLRSQFVRPGSIVQAARSVGLSRRQFTDVFRKVTGQSWRQHIQILRLKHAANLLAETDQTISEVAFESGFEDLSNFHHGFKATYGCSPLSYREQRRVKLHVETATSRPHSLTPQQPAGFLFRGMKGWSWTPQQYLEEIPTLSALNMNFLMNCYRSLTVSAPGQAWCNEWWKPLNADRKEAFSEVVLSCARAGIDFCFAMHPQLASPRPLNPKDPEDIELFFQHYAWAQSLGVKWFSICLDDTRWGSAGPREYGESHGQLVNALFERLSSNDNKAQMIFCPALFWGDGTNPEHKEYLSAIAEKLHSDVFVFWSGDAIVTPRITRVAAESYLRVVQHRLFLWDNYPVNDGSPTMHLGPVGGRDPDLCDVVAGYLSNPMCSQNQINRIPLSTCADYALNPKTYNPARSISQAILRFGSTPAQQQVLKDLVEIYTGFIVVGGGTGTNPARLKFAGLLENGKVDAAQEFLHKVENVATGLAKAFPSSFSDARTSVLEDVKWLRNLLARS